MQTPPVSKWNFSFCQVLFFPRTPCWLFLGVAQLFMTVMLWLSLCVVVFSLINLWLLVLFTGNHVQLSWHGQVLLFVSPYDSSHVFVVSQSVMERALCLYICGDILSICVLLTLNFLVAVVNTLNTQTHSCKEVAEFWFEVKSISYCNRGRKANCRFLQNVLKRSFVSHTRLSLHTYTACVEWCGIGH